MPEERPTGGLEIPANVFLVEDSSDDEYFIRRAMERLFPEIRIEVAPNGEDAVARLMHSNMPEPELILLDIKLPRINGLEVLEKLRTCSRYDNVPIVMLTSSNERADIDRAYQLRANGYVQKPVQFDEYVERFATLLHYWLVVNNT